MGGGVIIKPTLDALTDIDLATIGVLSSATVLTMSIVSVIKGFQGKLDVDKQLVTLALSGIVGGFIGSFLFTTALEILPEQTVNAIQIILNLALLIFCIISRFFKTHNVTSIFMFILVGTGLGTLSTFIGIGGGPINIALIVLVFGFDIKKAVTSSLFIIMFSQIVSLGTAWVETSFSGFDLTPLYYMLPAAVIGGLSGSILCKKLSESMIKKIYTAVVVGLIGLNIYNLIVTLAQ